MCPSLAAKKRRAVSSVSSGYQLPATSQRCAGLVAIVTHGGRLRTVTIATATAMLMGSCFASSTTSAAIEYTNDACAGDPRMAVARARQALQDDAVAQDRAALACLVEAVAALDDRIQGLSDGSVPFEGQVYAPKGVVMVKPSDQEGR